MVFKFETHEFFALTEEWDRSPSSILWSEDGRTLFLTVEEHGRIKLFELAFTPDQKKTHNPKEIVSDHAISGVFRSGKDLLISQSSLTDPSLYTIYSPTQKSLLTTLPNPWPQNPLSHKSVREFWFPGSKTRVHGFLHLPENFDKTKKYGLAFLIHGGPQGAWEDGWSTRWNPAVFANAGEGWVVAAVNPTGSTGYGQEFTDGIQGNWGTTPCTITWGWG
jgi:dipeptidyl aminopeptidase/acylaminoacyl peptidase